ncbi:uncharacterized protein FOMMEDRAFT_145058 [Fomitiporia mediterranea MF3/22]|uniref:uncharacterized protein n=1 Tax=Fomitiporia mediterranea (strain MF3/22) TaxID=694068 RepID=UPI0004409CBE|nr:uncharacterized protein FOMMEDRAFT_145058 [Fomitiporia mediterranea MF3/22]EJD05556.1 hypothetical protein FOMMEDRAFT_145058 [Fomitiporia mediterranea MF3/22]
MRASEASYGNIGWSPFPPKFPPDLPASFSQIHRRNHDHKKPNDLGRKLFPRQYHYHHGFTSAFGVFIPGVTPVFLDDDALNVDDVENNTSHDLVVQEGKVAWEAIYPEGSWNPSNVPRGGFGLYIGGSDEFVEATAKGADEVMLSYSVMFESGFEWNKGGKLPGGYGGEGKEARGCSGGRQEERAACFDARLMWRTNGTGELYTYLPITEGNNASQAAVPGTVVDSSYGYSVGRGAFTWPSAEWVAVVERLKLNAIGKTNGEIDLWVEGKKVISLADVTLREEANATIQGFHFQTFFGGSTSDWASPKTQKAWFADVSGAVISSGPGAPQHNPNHSLQNTLVTSVYQPERTGR